MGEDLHLKTFHAALFITLENWEKPKCPSAGKSFEKDTTM